MNLVKCLNKIYNSGIDMEKLGSLPNPYSFIFENDSDTDGMNIHVNTYGKAEEIIYSLCSRGFKYLVNHSELVCLDNEVNSWLKSIMITNPELIDREETLGLGDVNVSLCKLIEAFQSQPDKMSKLMRCYKKAIPAYKRYSPSSLTDNAYPFICDVSVIKNSSDNSYTMPGNSEYDFGIMSKIKIEFTEEDGKEFNQMVEEKVEECMKYGLEFAYSEDDSVRFQLDYCIREIFYGMIKSIPGGIM